MDFQHYAIKAEENSMIQERKRISREIHDTVGYTLTNIIMMMQAAMDIDIEDYERVRGILLQTRTQAQAGLKETRRALRELRSMDEQTRIGLKALYYLTSTFQRATGVEVLLESGNTPWSLGDEIDQVIYRLVQEGMTNSFRHGRASKIAVNLWQDKEGVLLSIQDNGKGCGSITEGIGISGMKERISALGGRMDIGNTAQGFKVSAFIPTHWDDTNIVNYQELF
jgi:signal transduction histidine kinase